MNLKNQKPDVGSPKFVKIGVLNFQMSNQHVSATGESKNTFFYQITYVTYCFLSFLCRVLLLCGLLVLWIIVDLFKMEENTSYLFQRLDWVMLVVAKKWREEYGNPIITVMVGCMMALVAWGLAGRCMGWAVAQLIENLPVWGYDCAQYFYYFFP